MKYRFIMFSLTLVILVVSFATPLMIKKTENEEEVIINKLYQEIKSAQEKGEYHCCIEPPCTMCYLGKWKFEKGTCDCDKAIRESDYDKICPECKSKENEELCESKQNQVCDVKI